LFGALKVEHMMNEGEGVQSMVLGDVEVIRILEWHEPFLPTAGMFRALAADVWKDNEDWLAPDHWEPDGDLAVLALQSWVLRSAGQTVLVDTGAGNGRERPGMGPFHHARSDLLGLLARAGVRPLTPWWSKQSVACASMTTAPAPM